MFAIANHASFAGPARLRASWRGYRKALPIALFLMALFSTRAFAEQKLFAFYPFASWQAGSLLAVYFSDLQPLAEIQNSTRGGTLAPIDWSVERNLSLARTFES